MNKLTIIAIAILCVGLLGGIVIYGSDIEVYDNICYAEVSGEFDSIQITSTYLTGGVDKEGVSINLVAFERGETNKTFKDSITRNSYAWGVNVYCSVNGILEDTHFDMVSNSTMITDIHSSGVNLTITRNMQVIVPLRDVDKGFAAVVVFVIFAMPMMYIAFGGTREDNVSKEND